MKRAKDGSLKFITLSDLEHKMQPGKVWLGWGFEWDKEVANRAYDLMRRGINKVLGKVETEVGGAFWMQGLAKPTDFYISEKFLEGHTLIVGTTGAGKTRMYDILISQLILKNDSCVIIIDPKGDKEAMENAKLACEYMGAPERFAMFHPAFASTSVRIDPVKNWNRGTEIASRITDIMPSSGSGDPFKDIAWNALNVGVQGMIDVGEKPSLMSIRRYIEGGPGPLLERVLQAHFARWSADWENAFRVFRTNKVRDGATMTWEQNLAEMIRFYQQQVSPSSRSEVIEGLISSYEHNREHFQKLIASLVPVLNMLTSDVMGELLSPDYSDPDDTRQIIDMGKVVRDKMVVYLALDSLSDSTVGSAIGSMVLADLTAVAGNIYNYESKSKVNLLVDEASEVLNKPTIQMLNKARGAGFRLFLATQTLSDVEVRLGGKKANALQALGNINNNITLRVKDADTQKYIANGFPTTVVESLKTGYKEGTGEFGSISTNRAGYGESLEQKEMELIPPPLLGQISNLNFIAQLADGRVVKAEIPILKRE
jgi:conjugal transfer pilus assembly protein TraD